MNKKVVINLRGIEFPQNDRTDKNFIAQLTINLQSLSTSDNAKTAFLKHLSENGLWVSQDMA